MSLVRVIKLNITKRDSDDNVSNLKANRKTFKTVTALNQHTEIFGFRPDRLVVQIDEIEHCKWSSSRSSGVYAKIAKKFPDDKSWTAAN